jgi:hypothetical protein
MNIQTVRTFVKGGLAQDLLDRWQLARKAAEVRSPRAWFDEQLTPFPVAEDAADHRDREADAAAGEEGEFLLAPAEILLSHLPHRCHLRSAPLALAHPLGTRGATFERGQVTWLIARSPIIEERAGDPKC